MEAIACYMQKTHKQPMTSTVTPRKSQIKISLDPVAAISVAEEEEGEELSEEVDVDQVKLCGGGETGIKLIIFRSFI